MKNSEKECVWTYKNILTNKWIQKHVIRFKYVTNYIVSLAIYIDIPIWFLIIAPDAEYFFLYFSTLFVFYYPGILNMLIVHIGPWFCSLAECQPTFELTVEWFRICWNVKLGTVFSTSFLKDSYLSKYIESSHSKKFMQITFPYNCKDVFL